MALTSLSAIYIHSCGVVTILLPLILSFLCLSQVYLIVAPSHVVNFNVLLLFTLLMLDEISFRYGLLHSVSYIYIYIFLYMGIGSILLIPIYTGYFRRRIRKQFTSGQVFLGINHFQI
jgi:hypothetical protein